VGNQQKSEQGGINIHLFVRDSELSWKDAMAAADDVHNALSKTRNDVKCAVKNVSADVLACQSKRLLGG